MGYYCTVPQCTSLAGKTKNVKFHRFPRDITMADKWNSILKRGKPYTKYSKVCSLHFTQSDYNVTTMGQWKTLSKDAIPSQNLPKLNPDGTPMVIRKSRTVKYKETKKIDVTGDKSDKWIQSTVMSHTTIPTTSASDSALHPTDAQDASIAYRLQTLNTIANHVSPQSHSQNHKPLHIKPKKDALIQTDPVQSEEDENQPNNSYSEASEKSYSSDQIEQYTVTNQYQKEENFESRKSYELPKDYTKTNEDYIPQTNEEYNKEAEKYALERKSHGGYEKPVLDPGYQKLTENGYQKLDMYTTYSDKQPADYQNRAETYLGYQNAYTDSVEMLRNQQHNLQMLQEQHRITENQNFFNENHIKQEVDVTIEEDKFLYERTKDQLEASGMYGDRRLAQQRLLDNIHHQVKQEPDAAGCETTLQPQQSPYYPNGHNDATGGYYEPVSRPGPELLIAKQNALAAHTQLWQNTMKRPFFYSETQHYNTSPLLHRYDEISRILQ